VNTNICGPTRVRSFQGDRYFILFIDDCSRMTWVTFLKEKSKSLDKFKYFKEMVENELDMKIKCLRSDRGGEFTSNEFNMFCENHQIKRHIYAPRTPQWNGVVERKNMTIQEAVRTMIKEANLLEVYWREAIHTAIYIQNRVQVKLNDTKTPYELCYGRIPTTKYLNFFGSKCYKRRDEELGKFDERCDEGIFLGYSNKSKAYSCYNERLRKIVQRANFKVDEDIQKFSEINIYESNESSCGEKEETKGKVVQVEEQEALEKVPKTPKYVQRHDTEDQIIGDKSKGVLSRSRSIEE